MATLKVEHIGTPRRDIGYIADRNLYLDDKGNIVEEDNPAQVRQLVGKGGALSTEDATKYGLPIMKPEELAKPKPTRYQARMAALRNGRKSAEAPKDEPAAEATKPTAKTPAKKRTAAKSKTK